MFLLCLLIIDELVQLLIIIDLLNGFLLFVVMNTKTMTTTKEWSRWHYAKTMDYDYIHDWFCYHTQHVWLNDYVVE
jgi:hypothetical protein